MAPLGRALLGVVPLAAVLVANLAAQGVTTASIGGIVSAADSSGILSATVTVTNTATGERRQAVTGGRGRYLVQYLSVGGPYVIEVRAIGYLPATTRVAGLSVGERHRVDVVMTPTVAQLAEVVVTVPRNPLLNAGRTGPAQTIDGDLAAGLPLADRDFSQLVLLSPQAIQSRDTGISIAGQPDRLNSLQVDGVSTGDLGGIHGISGFGTAGGDGHLRTVSIEAIEEVQILTAPFDVRYGNFAGGLVNVVTRSGSNRWEGSLSTYLQDQSLTGSDSAGNPAEDFSDREVTVTLAGPIVRDRAAFFLDAGLQRFVGPQGPSIGTDTTGGADSVGIGVRRATAERFQNILRDTYHVDPGSIGAPPLRNPTGNLLAKITLWPAVNQRLEVSHNYAQGRWQGGLDGHALSSQAVEQPSTINTTRLAWTVSGRGRLANELTVARMASRERCLAVVSYPEIDVIVSPDPNFQLLSAGKGSACPDRFADQTTWELTDNASWAVGTHHLTLGTHDEFIQFNGSRRVRVPAGWWSFSSLEALEAGMADEYVRDFAPASRPEGPVSDFSVNQFGFYLQDQWTPAPRLTLTAGLRVDVPFLPQSPAQNPMLLSSLGVNTAVTPSGHALWSPRLGFNYDVGGRGNAFLRGGVGLFAGRPFYLYFSNIYETTGLDWLHVGCSGEGNVPAFTIDPARQPTECLGESQQPVAFEVNYFNPAFHFPSNFRASLGGDARLPGGLLGTVDLLFIRSVNQFDIVEVNLKPPTPAAGEGGRLMYGTIEPEPRPRPPKTSPRYRDPRFHTVAEMRNSSGDRTISASGQVLKPFGRGAELSLAYTYTDARDRMSPDCFNITCNLFFTPLDSTPGGRLAASTFGVSHKITLAGVVNLPLRFRLGLFYNRYSGRPYTYVVEGDANADGHELIGLGNDALYVPRDSADITLLYPEEWGYLDKAIRSDKCLSSQRGHVMRRNSCRGHPATVVNTRVSHTLGLGGSQSVELTVDIFNVLNLVDRDWGVRRNEPSFLGDPTAVFLRGYDPANQRGIYEVAPVDRNVRDEGSTRWHMMLGARYAF